MRGSNKNTKRRPQSFAPKFRFLMAMLQQPGGLPTGSLGRGDIDASTVFLMAPGAHRRFPMAAHFSQVMGKLLVGPYSLLKRERFHWVHAERAKNACGRKNGKAEREILVLVAGLMRKPMVQLLASCAPTYDKNRPIRLLADTQKAGRPMAC